MVLVVDDDHRIVELLRLALSKEGYRVETALDGVEAYDHLRSPDCKCMLLDVNMPRLNGIELLMLMQSEGIKVPTILMAGFEDFEESEMKQFESVVKYMGKPFSADDAVNAIREYALPPRKAAKHAAS